MPTSPSFWDIPIVPALKDVSTFEIQQLLAYLEYNLHKKNWS